MQTGLVGCNLSGLAPASLHHLLNSSYSGLLFDLDRPLVAHSGVADTIEPKHELKLDPKATNTTTLKLLPSGTSMLNDLKYLSEL